jgi:hypothetical protein
VPPDTGDEETEGVLLEALLDKYDDEGVTHIEDLNVLKVQPLNQFGGNVLGLGNPDFVALKGRNKMVTVHRICPCFALSGLRELRCLGTQGVALG